MKKIWNRKNQFSCWVSLWFFLFLSDFFGMKFCWIFPYVTHCCVSHMARAPEGRKARSQAGPEGPLNFYTANQCHMQIWPWANTGVIHDMVVHQCGRFYYNDYRLQCVAMQIKPSKMEVAPQGCLQITNKKTTHKINWVRFSYKG